MADVELVTVFEGPLWQADLLNGLLEGEGVSTYLPDHTTKFVDPFITGPNPLAARIQVKAEDEERAVEILEARKSTLEKPFAEEDEEDEDEEDLSPEEELELLASRTRWACFLTIAVAFVPLPLMLFYGITYLQACRAYGKRAKHHFVTVFVAAAVLVTAALAVVALVVILNMQAERQSFIPEPPPPPTELPPIHPG